MVQEKIEQKKIEKNWDRALELYYQYHVPELSQSTALIEREQTQSEQSEIKSKLQLLAQSILKKIETEGILEKSEIETAQRAVNELIDSISTDSKKSTLFSLIFNLGYPILVAYLLKNKSQQEGTG